MENVKHWLLPIAVIRLLLTEIMLISKLTKNDSGAFIEIYSKNKVIC